ncbi:MAG TPA: cyclic nucleotide-binding domain-containing protein [Myxococcaceae bacterium]|nr:cyclic nucleotide-binding domain-containing protein [Myxococcaceae bacterium]
MISKLIDSPICQGLAEREAAAIFEIAHPVSVKSGMVLFREGDSADGLFVLIEGELEIVAESSDKQRHVLARISPGGVVGEMSLLDRSTRRSATAVALTDGRLLRLPADRFAQLLESDSVAALKMVHNVARVLAYRLQRMNEQVLSGVDKRRQADELVEFQRILNRWSF